MFEALAAEPPTSAVHKPVRKYQDGSSWRVSGPDTDKALKYDGGGCSEDNLVDYVVVVIH